MTNPNFVPAISPAELSAHCAAALKANADLVSSILKTLPHPKLESIDRLLAGGGSVGIEVVTDYKGNASIRLVALEHEGARLMLATIASDQPTMWPQ